jgi:aryl-alcohol dehydrogenase-like predicted oxidoreductase/histidinol phosphatase-like enzyme/predicted kinase
MIGLGCMRLSTREPRDVDNGIAVIHAALDAGATLLDTADAYALDDGDVGHNERLVAAALASWSGNRSGIRVATKGGLRRPGGAWVPDGRATHLRAACDASRRALGVDIIDLYQLHAVDPRVPLETGVRALAALQQEGKIRDIGLCNVKVSQIQAARAITPIAAVQVSLSVLDHENLRNGVAAYCRDHGILLIAYRPLGGERNARLARDPVLQEIAARHHVSPHVIALAWLRDLDPCVLPIPGATRVATAAAIRDVLRVALTDEDRAQLDLRFGAGRMLRGPYAERKPATFSDGDVVLIMGMPGAGKSTAAEEFVASGYQRLNRDEQGGRVSDLLAHLERGLRNGKRHWVLDNTYPTRSARNEVIETAWQHGVPVRCVHVVTPLADAQIRAVSRMIELHGRLPDPDVLRTLGRKDPRFFGPDAQFRYERQHEPPVLNEGFERIEERTITARFDAAFANRALVLELDDVLCSSVTGAPAVLDPDDVVIQVERAETLRRYAAEGWVLAALAWRPQIAQRLTTIQQVEACFDRIREILQLDLDLAYCPHPAGPPVCWCRKPLPGLLLQFAYRHRLALDRSLLVGRAPADRTLALRLGMTYRDASFLAQ